MSEIIFRNTNWKAIKILLKEIGAYRYESALEQMKIEQKPLSMKGFYLESNIHCTFLCYVYPSRISIRIMKVDEYMQIPKNDWVRVEKL